MEGDRDLGSDGEDGPAAAAAGPRNGRPIAQETANQQGTEGAGKRTIHQSSHGRRKTICCKDDSGNLIMVMTFGQM